MIENDICGTVHSHTSSTIPSHTTSVTLKSLCHHPRSITVITTCISCYKLPTVLVHQYVLHMQHPPPKAVGQHLCRSAAVVYLGQNLYLEYTEIVERQ